MDKFYFDAFLMLMRPNGTKRSIRMTMKNKIFFEVGNEDDVELLRWWKNI
jgi:hypothetical protein